MMSKRCEACNGRKKVPGLGMIMKNCSACKGVGFVSDKPVLEIKEKKK